MRTAVVTMATSNLRRNGDYWARRMKNMEDALLDQSYAYVENLDEQFRAAEAEIERQLSAWYQRFADNNEISLAEARKLLNSSELAEFRWTVEEYIKHGEENALTGAWMKEMENASARVHISRLDVKRTEKVTDVVNVGDIVKVKVLEIDDKGRLNLSRRDALIDLDGAVPENDISEKPRREHRDRDRRPRREHRE